jgi:hypothetical protein
VRRVELFNQLILINTQRNTRLVYKDFRALIKASLAICLLSHSLLPIPQPSSSPSHVLITRCGLVSSQLFRGPFSFFHVRVHA